MAYVYSIHFITSTIGMSGRATMYRDNPIRSTNALSQFEKEKAKELKVENVCITFYDLVRSDDMSVQASAAMDDAQAVDMGLKARR